MEDKAKKYYEYLKGKNVDLPPTFESFQSTLQDDDKRQKYYEYLSTKDVDLPPTFDSFSNTLVVKKKDLKQPQEEVSTEGSQTPATPSIESGKGIEQVDFDSLPTFDTLKDERLSQKPQFADLTEFQKKQQEIKAVRQEVESPKPLKDSSQKQSISQITQAYDSEMSKIEDEISSLKEQFNEQTKRLNEDFAFKIPSTTEAGNLYEIETPFGKQVVTGESLSDYQAQANAVMSFQKDVENKFKDLSKRYANLYVAKQRFELEKDNEAKDAVKVFWDSLPINVSIGGRLIGAIQSGAQQMAGSSMIGAATSNVGVSDEEIANASPEARKAFLDAREQINKEKQDIYLGGVDMLEKSAETSLQYGLASTLKDVDITNPQDLINYAVTAFGEQVPQYAQAALTLGYGTYIQELGSMQNEIVQTLMNEQGLTLEEALNDDRVQSIDQQIAALGIAALDLLGLASMGAGRLIKPLAKMNLAVKSMKPTQRAVIGQATEVGTEILQEAIAKGGVSSALDKGFIEGLTSLTGEEALEIGSKAFFGATPVTIVNEFTSKGEIKQPLLDEASINPRVRQVMEGVIRTRENAAIISTEEADRQIAELNESIAANLQIPENIKGEQRARIVELQKEYNALAEEQKRVPPAFKEIYKQKMDAVQEKIAEIVNEPQKKDEIEGGRQEELAILDAKEAESEKTGDLPTDENGNLINIKEEKQKVNAERDAEYVDAVKKEEMTREQAMQALEEAGRKESDAYAELAALEQQKPQEDVAQEQPTDEQFDAALEILEPIASERRELTLEELENVYTALGENADQVFDISRKDKNAVDLYNELTDKKNAKETRQVRKEGEQVQAEETGVGDMQEQPITQEETEDSIISEGVTVEGAPEGTYIDVEMIAGKDGRKLTPEEVLDAIPIDGIEFDNDGTNLRIKLPRELTSTEMMSLMKATEQEAIGQLSNGTGKLYAQSKKLLQDYGNEFNEKYFKTPREGKLKKYEKKPKAGNRIFNKPLEAVKEIANKYYERVFGKKRPIFKGIIKIDKKLAKRIANAYEAMKNNPNDPEVRAAYEALARETMEQYKAFSDAGFTIEINNEEPYNNAQEMIDDLRENRRIKIFSTESGFGDTPITDKQRKENPLLRDSGIKDANGNTLLINDVFRAIHDFYGHAELGNGFGAIGEENAWNVHARMFSPLARRAMTTETRGQNSWVNFSGINEEAFKLRDKARELRKQGKEAEAQELVKKVYEMMSFAEQKIGLLPEEFSRIYEGVLRQEQLQVGKAQEEVKVGDTVNATVEVYESGKKKSKRFKVEVTAVNDDGTYNLRRGKLIYKNIKPENIAKIKPPRARSITQETQGLTEKEQAKQGVEELVTSLKEKSREKLNDVTNKFKTILSEQRKKLKDFKDRKSTITAFAKDLLKGLSKSGVKYIPTSKIQGLINSIDQAKTDESLYNAAQKLIEQVNKIAVTDEEIKRKKKVTSAKNKVKKKAEKAGFGKFSQMIQKAFNLDENSMTDAEIKEVDDLMVDLADENFTDISEIANRLAELSDKYTNQATIKEEKVETASDKAKNAKEKTSVIANIIGKTAKSPEGVSVTTEEKSIIDTINSITKDELDNMSLDELKSLSKIIDRINQGVIEKDSQKLKERVLKRREAAKLKSTFDRVNLENLFKRFILAPMKAFFGKNITAIDSSFSGHIDSFLGLKGTEIAKFLNNFEKKYSDYQFEMKEARAFLNKLYGGISKFRQKRRIADTKIMMYAIQKQFEENPNSKIVHSLKDFYEATMGSETLYNDYERQVGEDAARIVKELYDKYSKNDITAESIWSDMSTQERKAYTSMRNRLESIVDRVVKIKSLDRGEVMQMINHYFSYPTLKEEQLTGEQALEQAQNGYISTRAGVSKSRQSKVSKINFSASRSFLNAIDQVSKDFNLGEALRVEMGALKELKESFKNDPDKAAIVNEFVDNIRERRSLLFENGFNETSKILNEIQAATYRYLLGTARRALVETTTNFTRVFLRGLFMGQLGKNGIKKAMFVVKNADKVNELIKTQGSDQKIRMLEGEQMAGYGDEFVSIGEDNYDLDFKDRNLDSRVAAGLRILSKPTRKMGTAFIQSPDKFFARMLFTLQFIRSFKNETGVELDFSKLSDKSYNEKYRQALDNARFEADQEVSDWFSTTNRAQKPLNQLKAAKGGVMNRLKYFMISFMINEGQALQKAIINKGAKGAFQKGIPMFTGMAMYQALNEAALLGFTKLLSKMFGDDDEDYDVAEKVLEDKAIQRGILGAFTELFILRHFNGVQRLPMNFILEAFNKRFGDKFGLREEGVEYDKYNSLVYNKIDLNGDIESIDIVGVLAPELTPIASAVESGLKASSIEPEKEKNLKKRTEKEEKEMYYTLKAYLTGAAAMGILPKDVRDSYVFYRNRELMFNGDKKKKTKSVLKPLTLKYHAKKRK